VEQANRPQDWKHFDDFAAGIATNRLAITNQLLGETLSIALRNGRKIRLRFASAEKVQWSEADRSGDDSCEAINVAPDVFFVSVVFSERPEEDEIFVVNMKTGRVLSVRERIRPADEIPGEPRVAQVYTAGILEGREASLGGIEPEPTRDLIGITAHYEYSPQHVYEHVYLSSQRYAWQNLVGVQRGHGDVDMATTYKFDHNQYVFGFREFIIPVASVFFYNWDSMRSTGKFLGVTSQGRIENKPAGALIKMKSKTIYDEGKEPV
jgi:hypothetical protein